METNVNYVLWPVTVEQVIIKNTTYTRNNKQVEATTYLVYIKKSMFQRERPIVFPLYVGTHDSLIAFYDDCARKDNEDGTKVIDRNSIEEAIKKRATTWASLDDVQKALKASDLVKKKYAKMTEEEKADVGTKWAMLPLHWNTDDVEMDDCVNGSMAMITDSLPIGDGQERFYVLDKEGHEVTRTQGGRSGEKVSQTHADVAAMVVMKQNVWVPMRGNTMEAALEAELRDQIDRGRFKKVLSTAEQMAAIKAMSESMNKLNATEPAQEAPAPAETPAPTAPAPATT